MSAESESGLATESHWVLSTVHPVGSSRRIGDRDGEREAMLASGERPLFPVVSGKLKRPVGGSRTGVLCSSCVVSLALHLERNSAVLAGTLNDESIPRDRYQMTHPL